ncbi:MAG: 1,6-anhydro-N-acetylmuramyl-L-alanine amidase AmpD [Rhodocyclales bacterium]|nr:1,6-anhydro-N-acetylmuramyl-L-alanine amidase AmpD [Rhodocyclales bacterium]
MNSQTTTAWHPGASVVPSPNFDQRPDGVEIDLIVIHSISLPPGQYGGLGIEQLFTNQLDPAAHPYYAQIAGLKVSSHFLIKRDGALVQFVPVAQRAWHAGVSNWQGRERCNDFSIGIELEGDDDTPFETAQYLTLQALLKSLVDLWPIKAITSHAHIAPVRKTDPGPCFDWSQVESLFHTIDVVR